ncbi:porin [Opitutaceae bacterium TAV4]|uniref:MIP/aquaporin family protein n=1 Tax=Geminisphaera colitermitum TaxID=1148786 RepID=UPI0001964F74|nr:aquaporin [Geminisphaera colitermitum]RRJ95263.1 porin [Opitutaceae bacterium TAV4]RRJ99516.1 porin [Opitutaceae bacterium TAV3]
MKKYIVEFIGTFFLVFTVGMAVKTGSPLAPLAIGSALMVMIYAGGHLSGGHFNPAVTLGVFLRGKCPAKDVIPYWIFQLAAGVVAAFAVCWLIGAPAVDVVVAQPANVAKAVFVEFLFTFALVWVVLNSATAKGTSGNSFYGLAIGFTVLVGAVAVGGISGGAFNPAVGLGVFVMKLASFTHLWIYIGADLVGGAVAAIAYKALAPRD